MTTPHEYQVAVAWTAGRQGMLTSEVLPLEVAVATPPEFPGGVAGIWSPEHLLVAAVNSCLMTTFLAIAELSKFAFQAYSSNSIGKLEPNEQGKLMVTEILLRPTVTIASEADRDRALRLLAKAEANCLITESVKTKVLMEPTVIVGS